MREIRFPAELRRHLRSEAREENPGLPADWALVEMREREMVLRRAGIRLNERVLEVGCGHHGLTTIPLALLVGPRGQVCAVERERWHGFVGRLKAAGVENRVVPVKCDARSLPFLDGWFDRAVSVHAVRSFHRRRDYVSAVREMLRVSHGPVVIAESLPEPRTPAQRAHLQAYAMRRPSHRAIGMPEAGDVMYPTREELRVIARTAGGRVRKISVFEPGLPAHLAHFPMPLVRRAFLSKIRDRPLRSRLERGWSRAIASLDEHGEEQLPVAVMEIGR